jgi:peptidyl-prolyl cis-trans isomerase D
MVSILRRFQRPLMIAVTLLVIISFIWLYNDTQFNKLGAEQLGKIYGRTISIAEVQRVGRKFDVCQDLAMRNMFQGLPVDLLRGLAISQQGAKENFVWNNLVLRHEAARLGVEPTDDEIFTATQALAAFQTKGQYDPEKYSIFVQNAVTPRGFTANDLGDIIADGLRLQKIQTLLGSTTAPTETELRESYSSFAQKTDASVIRLKLDDFLAAVQVPDDDVKKLFEARKDALKTDEFRKVKYVALILPTTDKPLEGRERADALTKLAKQAEDLTVAMTEKGAKFEEVAAKLGAKVEESSDFSRSSPPPAFAEVAAAVPAAFALTTEQPNSDVISTERGYYILQLSGIVPPRPLTFDEAKEKLTTELRRERAQETLGLKATEIRNKIDAALKEKKSFADAATAAGAKAEKYPAFSRQEPQMEPENSGEIMSAAGEMAVGQLSAPVPTANGSVIIYLEQRLPIDEEKYKAEKARVAEGLAGFQKTVLFSEWLKLRRAAAQLTLKTQG